MPKKSYVSYKYTKEEDYINTPRVIVGEKFYN